MKYSQESISNIITGVVGVAILSSLAILVHANAANSQEIPTINGVHAIVGSVEVSPGICQVDYYNTITKDLYQLNESCDNDNLN